MQTNDAPDPVCRTHLLSPTPDPLRRERIATAAMQGLLSNGPMLALCRDHVASQSISGHDMEREVSRMVVASAMKLTDMLILALDTPSPEVRK